MKNNQRKSAHIQKHIGDEPVVNGKQPCPCRGFFITDLDGTLFRSDRTAADVDLKTLKDLGKMGVVRAVATGRSLYSFKKAVGDTLPIDYVIFSTGSGILQYPNGPYFRVINLEPDSVKRCAEILMDTKLDFMIHNPIPENHKFAFWGNLDSNPDFNHRINLYRQFCRPLDESHGFEKAAQILAIVAQSDGQPLIAHLRGEIPELNIVRTTSPLDGESTWIEFFHKEVSKSQAAAWLAAELEIPVEKTLSVGNDYNDIDLLEWSGCCFVVENAPNDLKDRFTSVASHDACGVTEAVNRWLDKISIT
jgi:hydroxymethylpyrimidine pyrophosphatase-like HAD family hydrolase